VRHRARGRVAALSLAGVLLLAACGEKEERVPGPSHAEVRALLAAGLAAAGSDTALSGVSFRLEGTVLRIRAIARRPSGPLLRLAASFPAVRAQIEPFCPKPALLRCRPALRAWASARFPAAEARSVAALRRLAERTYGDGPLVRRGRRVTRLVTANGELLGAVRRVQGGLALSFGGLTAPRRRPDVATRRLVVTADAEGLGAARPGLPPAARRALIGVRRLIISVA
jgi:hypothetical protein